MLRHRVCRDRLPGETDGDRTGFVGGAADGHLAVALQNPVVGEQTVKLQIGTGRERG